MLLSKKNRQKRVDAAAIDASHHLTVDETTELEQLRGLAPAWLAAHQVEQPAFGERLADTVASLVGSWRFLIIQSVVLAGWVIVNLIGWIAAWDPYPFILLNLLLSLQSAYLAPIIMMSQNRQANIDRRRAVSDSEINLQAALEIKSLHQKMDEVAAVIAQLREERGSAHSTEQAQPVDEEAS